MKKLVNCDWHWQRKGEEIHAQRHALSMILSYVKNHTQINLVLLVLSKGCGRWLDWLANGCPRHVRAYRVQIKLRTLCAHAVVWPIYHCIIYLKFSYRDQWPVGGVSVHTCGSGQT